VYQVAKLKEEGWVTDLLYDDEVQVSELALSMVKLIAQIVTTIAFHVQSTSMLVVYLKTFFNRKMKQEKVDLIAVGGSPSVFA
jgi:hypothetical protein